MTPIEELYLTSIFDDPRVCVSRSGPTAGSSLACVSLEGFHEYIMDLVDQNDEEDVDYFKAYLEIERIQHWHDIMVISYNLTFDGWRRPIMA